jgi:hypothetical protein
MALAQIGPLTSVLEQVAMALAAGAVIASSAMGVVGLVARRSSTELERHAVGDGYIGAAVGALAALLDSIIVYLL